MVSRFVRLAGVRCFALVLVSVFLAIPEASAYSVLTHEAIIDSVWDASIKPLLLARFPASTPDELKTAHGYAYGGAILQDMGYYPNGSHLFSDLTHYVHSGQFVLNLIRESSNVNEYAFALGSLAHYAADVNGHSIAVNRAEPMLYPRIARKFGPVVTYEDNPSAHLKTEFSFDVLQVARGYYAPQAYHDFIGFNVAKPALSRAFQDTYCLGLDDVFDDVDHGISSYRHTVSELIPKATRVAWAMKKDAIEKNAPAGFARRKFIYNISDAGYRKEWGADYRKPGFGDRLVAFLLRLVPRIGPLRTLSFKTPTAPAEDLFMKSFDKTLDQYRSLLKSAGQPDFRLPDMNFDTGETPRPGAYRLADRANSEWNEKVKGVACPVRLASAPPAT